MAKTQNDQVLIFEFLGLKVIFTSLRAGIRRVDWFDNNRLNVIVSSIDVVSGLKRLDLRLNRLNLGLDRLDLRLNRLNDLSPGDLGVGVLESKPSICWLL